ncbi:MAG: ATP-dependent RNA helicase HrpA [Snodgrassella sp.]|uniref:ATP-dependent RNA helicase HrpA n=1 Tax=Snodgrassella sp. TaxID=2815304 RepID=UPI0025907A56|nr:ATP-dependent RNA helicase HrpA [Snodgrassella sp.]MCO6521241.1 ATP-dependent RNA helicase HrpA [Snodgrassella sp.]
MSAYELNQILSKDRFYLQQACKNPARYGGEAKVNSRYQRSHQAYLQRLARLPVPEYDNTLPVHEKRAAIKQAISQHQVVIICGETGSGKTTQLPKICLELGRGVAGLIGHTQPRRLAARSVAERIAEELHSQIGQTVGYKVRFNDKTAPESYIKLMTDGILLAESQTDRFLNTYDTIIIDEAHERSLNIDFLLGYLKQLLPRRPDLKVIITSATIDAERFSQHFTLHGIPAPVIEVSGRTYPVEIRYRPLHSTDADEAEIEINDAIVDAADELAREGNGDILIFLPGEREIREAAHALQQSPLRRNDQILPLFARLSAAEQHKIFHPNSGQRRIVLATNVAETSLTVPGIRYVIDTGLARVKRYSARAKVEQLHIEPISQAAARQRAGRCGRVAAGICIRLYSETDFNQRPAFTDPEIIRSNLAAVILRMISLKLGDVNAFPFLQAPEQRYINDGYQILLELGAVDEHNQLSKLGEQMARLPLDPRISRMLLAGKRLQCVAEMLVIVAALSIQDPRERPLEAREAATKAHERFNDKQSDFLAYLNIWDSYQRERDKGLSNRQMIQWCHQYFLSHLRMREWRELHHQLAQIAIDMGLTDKASAYRQTPASLTNQPDIDNNSDQDLSAKLKQQQIARRQQRHNRQQAKEASYEQIHRALLTGLITNIGLKSPEGHDYTGARGIHFHLFPASSLFKSKPKWVIAAELTETTRLYARDVGKIEPEWIESEVPHLLRHHYFEPHWEQKRGEVVASERITLYGLTVLPRRPVSYGRINPKEAREIFIRSALVAQECNLKAAFFQHNQKLIEEITELEHKSRRQDVLVDEEALFSFYDQRLPASVASKDHHLPLADIRTFETWRKQAEAENPQLLYLSRDDLMQHAASNVTENQFPEYLSTKDGRCTLSYRFEPHHPLDGVTVAVPLPLLNRISPARLEWLVPGMIREKLQLLIKALPKQIRRICVPVPDFITTFLSSNPDTNAPLLPQLAHAIARQAGDMRLLSQIDIEQWRTQQLPAHCYFNIQVIDDSGTELASGRDLSILQQQLGQAAAVTFRDNSNEFERDNITNWDIGKLPESIKFARAEQQLTGYLGLQLQKNGSIALRLFDTAIAAEQAHRSGVLALMSLHLKEQIKDLNKGLPDFTQIAMLLKHLGTDTLREDLTHTVLDRALIGEDDLPRDEKSFKEQLKRARSRLPAVKEAVNHYALQTAQAYAEVNSHLGKHPLTQLLRQHLNSLIYPGFASATPWQQWPRLPIYLQAMLKRMDKYSSNIPRDTAREADIQALTDTWQEKISQYKQQNQPIPTAIAEFRWMLEELRVSLFAQELKTPYPVSAKRLSKEWDKRTAL